MAMSAVPHPPSPCTQTCRIDEDAGICTECYRTIDEIAAWIDASAEEKWRVLEFADKRRAGPGESA